MTEETLSAALEREHGELWDAMSDLDDLLTDEAEPATIEEACRELLARLDAHNSKEEPIIYPQADAQLSDDAASRLHDFHADGLMPTGWRCERATR